MSWVVAGVAAGTAVLGAVQASQQRKAQQQANQQQANISAAQTEFSPWTKIQPQGFNPEAPTASALGGAVQGGLGGAMFAKQFQGGAKKSESPDMPMSQQDQQNLAAGMGPAEEERRRKLMMGLA
jgi:type II secretory pathway pseudopilin PulG